LVARLATLRLTIIPGFPKEVTMRPLRSRVALVAALSVIVAGLAGAGVARAADPSADLMESMKKLSTLKYYKARTSISFDMSPQMAQQMEMMRSMGMGDVTSQLLPKGGTQEFVNPGLRRMTMPQRMPSRSGLGAPLQMLEANIITVIRATPGSKPQ